MHTFPKENYGASYIVEIVSAKFASSENNNALIGLGEEKEDFIIYGKLSFGKDGEVKTEYDEDRKTLKFKIPYCFILTVELDKRIVKGFSMIANGAVVDITLAGKDKGVLTLLELQGILTGYTPVYDIENPKFVMHFKISRFPSMDDMQKAGFFNYIWR